MSLPIGMSLTSIDGAAGSDEDEFSPQLATGDDVENEFIDFAIEESYRRIVR